MKTDPPTQFPDLTMDLVSEALGAPLNLCPKSPKYSPNKGNAEQSELLRYLQRNHNDLLNQTAFIDLTIYEYGKETLPIFQIIAPNEEIVTHYRKKINNFLEPRDSDSGGLTFSVALHPDFRTKPSLRVVALEPCISASDDSSTETKQKEEMAEEYYPLRTYGPNHHQYPSPEEGGVDLSLSKLKNFMTQPTVRQELVDRHGRVINNIICCNYLVSMNETTSRTLGQIFLGVSTREVLDHTSGKSRLLEPIRAFLGDLGLLLYRNNAGSLLFAAGEDISRQTFAHETKRLVKTLMDWSAPLTDYFESRDDQKPDSFALRPEKAFVEPSNLGVIPLFNAHQAGLRHLLQWTMADAPSDLPFYCRGSLPENFVSLVKACAKEAWDAFSYSLFYSLASRQGDIHELLAEFEALFQWLQSQKPEVRVDGNHSILPKIGWHEEDFRPSMVDFSRLILMSFREAYQHGSWAHGIDLKFTCELNRKNFMIEICNRRLTDEQIKHEGSLLPGAFAMVKAEDLINVRSQLNRSSTLGGTRHSGQTQLDFLTEAAGGSLSHSGPWEDDKEFWSVIANFPITNPS